MTPTIKTHIKTSSVFAAVGVLLYLNYYFWNAAGAITQNLSIVSKVLASIVLSSITAFSIHLVIIIYKGVYVMLKDSL